MLNLLIPDLLVRLLIGVLVYWIGEKIISLVNGEVGKILSIILIVFVVLYVIFGGPIR